MLLNNIETKRLYVDLISVREMLSINNYMQLCQETTNLRNTLRASLLDENAKPVVLGESELILFARIAGWAKANNFQSVATWGYKMTELIQF